MLVMCLSNHKSNFIYLVISNAFICNKAAGFIDKTQDREKSPPK